MWADFLSHFSEIGMVEGAESYQVIKQRPADYDQQQAQVSTADPAEEEAKAEPFAPASHVMPEPQAAATPSNSDNNSLH